MSSFDDPNFYLAASTAPTQTSKHSSTTSSSRSPSPPNQNDILSLLTPLNLPDHSSQLHQPISTSQSNAVKQVTTKKTASIPTSAPAKKSSISSSKSQFQEQLQLLLTSPNGVTLWCDYNAFDTVITQNIAHLQGHDLLTLSKSRLMTLIKSPKHGLLVWTRLKHLADAVAEHQLSVEHLISQQSTQITSLSSPLSSQPQTALPYNPEFGKNGKNDKSDQADAKSDKYPSQYTQPSHQSQSTLHIPQYNALLDIQPQSTSNKLPSTAASSNTSFDKSRYNNPNIKPSTCPPSVQHTNVFDYSAEDTTTHTNNAEYQYRSLSSSPDQHPRYSHENQLPYPNSDQNTPDYVSYTNSNEPRSHYQSSQPITTQTQPRSIYLSNQPTGTGSLRELLDVEPGNLMKYFTWNGFTQTLYSSYGEWSKIITSYQETRPDIYIDVARRVKQREEENEYKDSLRKPNLVPDHNTNFDNISHDDEESQQKFTHIAPSSKYVNKTTSYQIHRNETSNEGHFTGTGTSTGTISGKYSNYGTNDDFDTTHDEYDDYNDNGPTPFSLTPSQRHAQHHDNEQQLQSPQVQCEFGTCEYLTELKCSQPLCQISLCGKHIVKDIITGHYYCPTCYQSTYTYSMLNNGLTQYCNIQ